MLLLNGYYAHLQYKTLKLFRDNNIITIAVPSHSTHELQPLDVTVFGACKSFLQRELHRASKNKKPLIDFDIASIIRSAYSVAFVGPTIASAFIRCGVWSEETGGTNIDAVRHLFPETNRADSIGLDELLRSFMTKQRSLLREVNVKEEGRIRIDTKTGAHVTSEAVLTALKKSDDKKRSEFQRKQRMRSFISSEKDYKEPPKDVKRLVELSEMRNKKRKQLNLNRNSRRKRQKIMVAFHCVQN